MKIKQIIDLNVTIQPLEENTGENLSDFGLGNGISEEDFLGKTQKSTNHTRKIARVLQNFKTSGLQRHFNGMKVSHNLREDIY